MLLLCHKLNAVMQFRATQDVDFAFERLITYPENNPSRLVGVESDAGPDCGVFDVFLSMNFPKIPDISLSIFSAENLLTIKFN